MKVNFRKIDIIFILIISLVFLAILIVEAVSGIPLINYYVAFSVLVLIAIVIYMLRSLRIELLQFIQDNHKKNYDNYQGKIDADEFNDAINSSTALKMLLNQNYFQIESLLSVYSIIEGVRHPLPSFRNWALSPDAMKVIISHVLINKPGLILELGSGTSSIVLGYCLEKIGQGKVISIDHSLDYSRRTEEQIRNHQLEEFVEVKYEPLKVYNFDGKDHLWYSMGFTKNISDIDLLIVDGPPGILQKNARYPSLPLLNKYLSANVAIFIDDGSRSDEKEIVSAWQESFKDIKAEYIGTEKGLYLITFPGRTSS